MYKSSKGKKIADSKRMSVDEFISRSNEKHANAYTYNNVVYYNAHTHVNITCPLHGDWSQTPMNHITGGYGCPTCGNIKKGLSKSLNAFKKFLEFSNKKHNEKYTYLADTFVGMTKPMSIICPSHGLFSQAPDVHRRAGCQRCGSGPVSETSQKWLDFLNIPLESREVWIHIGKKRIKVDAYDASTNTIYEFWGDYWHGNPNTYDPTKMNTNNKQLFGILYSHTCERIRLIESNGYKLIQIWESDWLKTICDSAHR